jgi:hypothetical protein
VNELDKGEGGEVEWKRVRIVMRLTLTNCNGMLSIDIWAFVLYQYLSL